MGDDCSLCCHLRMVVSRGAFRVARFLQSIEAARRALIPHGSLLCKSSARRIHARKGKAAQANH